uniref:Secreted frizzled-related protein 3 n=1 Tax=Zonotrichia albicollis TaxID=44394 RepID=A0A8D2MY93_ZONAL
AAGPGRAAAAGAAARGPGGGLRAGAHPALQAAALEHDQDAEPPAPQHAGQRRAGHGAVRGAAGHQLQPRPAVLPVRHVRAHLHHRLPARAHQALQVRLRARPRRLRARPGPLQPRLARQPGLRRAARVRPRGLHLPRGHRHRRGRGFLTVLPSSAFPDFPMDSNNGNCRGAGIERCKCKPVKATQKTYLRNNYNYVIRAKVKEVKTKCHDVTAVVEVKEILKSSLVNIPKDTVNLHTNSGCLCPPLSANEEYIIMGYEDEERSRLLLVEGSIAEKWKERLGKKIKVIPAIPQVIPV